MLPGTHELLAGAEHRARGDDARAAQAFRAVLRSERMARAAPVVDAFDRVGDVAAAERAEAPVMSYAGYNGATLAHLRAARRALKRCDRAHARELAAKIVEAWSAADVSLDAVKEMRGLLR